MNKLLLLKGLTLALLLPLPNSAFSCEVSTTPIQFEKFIPQNEFEIASDTKPDHTLIYLNNGDMIISYVEQCGLGKELLYLSHSGFSTVNERRNKAIWLFKLLERHQAKTESQLHKISPRGNITITGEYHNEEHIFTFNQLTTADNPSSLFAESISYQWVPPENH